MVLLVLLIGGFGEVPVKAVAAVGDNPILDEMVIVDKAFREIVSAVAVGSGPKVLRALQPLHAASEKTYDDLHSGALTLPKNEKNISEFVNMDEKFHHHIEKLAEAAHKDNKDTMLSITKKLMDACVNCHKTFKQ